MIVRKALTTSGLVVKLICVKVTTVRWILAPISSWRTYRLMVTFAADLPYEAAWQMVRLRYHIDELPYVRMAAERARMTVPPQSAEVDPPPK
nr:hypothetical protein KitaXyl93_39030 [Kitasatospora sp. Xyl93]